MDAASQTLSVPAPGAFGTWLKLGGMMPALKRNSATAAARASVRQIIPVIAACAAVRATYHALVA